MTPSAAEAERKRAARAGRRMLSRTLPPGCVRWVERLARAQASPEEVYAWSGALAAIATELEQAFHESGTEVRDLILSLHTLISEGEDAEGRPAGKELEPFLPWLRRTLEASSESPSMRIVLMQWIDVASERLTLRRYHRPDLPVHHARTLIVHPAGTLGILLTGGGDETGAGLDSRDGNENRVALAVLRFVDLLDAGRLGSEGKNRISAPDTGEFGGFYGVSENVQPPSAEELHAELEGLKADTVSLLGDSGLPPALKAILEDIERALTHRTEHGIWPEAYRWKSPDERRRSVSLVRRLFGGR